MWWWWVIGFVVGVEVVVLGEEVVLDVRCDGG